MGFSCPRLGLALWRHFSVAYGLSLAYLMTMMMMIPSLIKLLEAARRGCLHFHPLLLFSVSSPNIIHAQSMTQRRRQTLFYRVKYDSRCWCSTSRHYRHICPSTLH